MVYEAAGQAHMFLNSEFPPQRGLRARSVQSKQVLIPSQLSTLPGFHPPVKAYAMHSQWWFYYDDDAIQLGIPLYLVWPVEADRRVMLL